MELHSQLLCTFSSLEGYSKDIETIQISYEILNKCVFVLQSLDEPNDIFLTYNVLNDTEVRLRKTISVHRKKGVNVIYSINALNQLILNETGYENHSQQIDWTKYKNSVIINFDSELKIIPTKLFTIARLK
jgi:hypothetical protein